MLVVNKADREGADRTERDLMHMLDLRTGDRKDVEIVRTIATRGTAEGSGIAELAHGRSRRTASARGTGEGAARARERARATAQLAELVRALLADRAARAMAARGGLHEIAQAVVEQRQRSVDDRRRARSDTVGARVTRGHAHCARIWVRREAGC